MLPVREGVEVLDEDVLEQDGVRHVQVGLDAAELAPDGTIPAVDRCGMTAGKTPLFGGGGRVLTSSGIRGIPPWS